MKFIKLIYFLPHDNGYKYALAVVDVASRYKQAEPLKTKSATEVASAFERIYRRGPLRWPNLLQVDPGKEFQGLNDTINIGFKKIHNSWKRMSQPQVTILTHNNES